MEKKELIIFLLQQMNEHPHYIPSGEPLDKWLTFLTAIVLNPSLYEHIKSELEKWDYSPEIIEHIYVTALKAP